MSYYGWLGLNEGKKSLDFSHSGESKHAVTTRDEIVLGGLGPNDEIKVEVSEDGVAFVTVTQGVSA